MNEYRVVIYKYNDEKQKWQHFYTFDCNNETDARCAITLFEEAFYCADGSRIDADIYLNGVKI